MGPSDQCYKTFSEFTIFHVFVLGKPFQHCVMIAGKAGAYPSEAPFRCSTLG
jgi:hypothetical protein